MKKLTDFFHKNSSELETLHDDNNQQSSEQADKITILPNQTAQTPNTVFPYQPKHFNFPKKDYSDRKRSCQNSWFQDYPWLHYNVTKDVLLCFTCIQQHEKGNLRSCHNKENAFIEKGFSNWKKATSRFREHQVSLCHRTALDYETASNSRVNIELSLSEQTNETTAINRKCFMKVLKAMQLLAKQGQPFRGKVDEESNLLNLLKLLTESDEDLKNWIEKQRDKYYSHSIQSEILTLMSNDVLRTLTSKLDGKIFGIIADEYTDTSNKELMTICFRWVDDELTPNEDFFGFYHIPNTKADTLVAAIKDVLIRLNLPLERCRAQCYDGASNMMGKRTGVATQILKSQPKAFATHCFAHSLSLSVKDVTNPCKVLSNVMKTAKEITTLIKYSPKREAMLGEIKNNLELEEDIAGVSKFSATRWTVRASCFKRILDNYLPLLKEWEECLEQGNLLSDVRGRIIGCQAQMTTFDFFFGLNLGILLYRHTDNLSKTLQGKDLSAASAYNFASLTRKAIETMRTDNAYNLFYEATTSRAERIHQINEPRLGRKRRVPDSLEVGHGPSYHPSEPKTHYRQIYFEAVDLIVTSIKNRFEQPGYHASANMEQLLLKALKKADFQDEIKTLEINYPGDFDIFTLESQLPLLPILLKEDKFESINDVLPKIKEIKQSKWSIIGEVIKVIELLLVNPATSASGERSFSAARRLKTWLRSSMTMEKFNSVAILHSHKRLTENIDLISIANQFSEANPNRQRNFGKF